jgi:FAD/FMN-containing dehydrogenase
MNHTTPTRREILRKLASGPVIGALGSLRSGTIFAGQTDAAPGGSISGVEGTVVRRGDENYELWRQSMVWHKTKPSRYPDIIIPARSEEDVVGAVKFAAQNKLKLAVRSGGHNSTGSSLRDGGVCIDLSSLNDVQVDVSGQIARVQPGARSIQLAVEAGARGFSFPVPHCPTVGLGGFLMGGGIGLNYTHRGGFACLSVDAAEIVMADGHRVMTSANENPDLYWAVRGAGPGFFGIVTRFHLRLYPTPRGILSNSYIHPLDGLEMVTTALDKMNEIKDERVEVLALLMHSPDAPPDAPPEESKICFITAFAFADSVAEARSMLAPFARSALAKASVAKVENEELSFAELYKFFGLDTVGGKHGRYAVDNVMTDEPGKAFYALADHFRHTPSPGNHVLAAYGMNLRQRDDSCLSSIANNYFGCYVIWDNEEDDELNYRWLDQTLPLMYPFSKGHYINEIEAGRHPERIRECFSDVNWQRLQDLRRKYDPNNVFHTYLGNA